MGTCRPWTVLILILMPPVLCMHTPGAAQLTESRITTAELRAVCDNSEIAVDHACSGFLSGAAEGLIIGQLIASDAEPTFCPPEKLLVGELKSMFLDFSTEHPEQEAEDASLTLLNVLEFHFPCAMPEADEEGENAPTALIASVQEHRGGRAKP